MINFVSGSPERHQRLMALWGYGHLAGQMSCPFARNNVTNGMALGMRWCLDNGCFNRYDPKAIRKMLVKNEGLSGCTFATIPDVVSDHNATLKLFREWIGVYRDHGYPAAFVLQDGLPSLDAIPWDEISAIFIGGSKAFKYSQLVRDAVTEAHRLQKWAHMGRVNSLNRILYSVGIHCDSSDGTGFLRFETMYRFSYAFASQQSALL